MIGMKNYVSSKVQLVSTIYKMFVPTSLSMVSFAIGVSPYLKKTIVNNAAIKVGAILMAGGSIFRTVKPDTIPTFSLS